MVNQKHLVEDRPQKINNIKIKTNNCYYQAIFRKLHK